MPHFDNLSAEELERIKRFIEKSDIDVIDDEMRELAEKLWPWLLAKLPPKPNSKGAGRSGLPNADGSVDRKENLRPPAPH